MPPTMADTCDWVDSLCWSEAGRAVGESTDVVTKTVVIADDVAEFVAYAVSYSVLEK